jgi:hypothetical protein
MNKKQAEGPSCDGEAKL